MATSDAMNAHATTEPNAIVSLSERQLEDLRLSFAAMNPIEFAAHLHALDLPIEIQRAWLRAKVDLKPTECAEALQNAIKRALGELWTRLGAANHNFKDGRFVKQQTTGADGDAQQTPQSC
jgi:hypothetical protein